MLKRQTSAWNWIAKTGCPWRVTTNNRTRRTTCKQKSNSNCCIWFQSYSFNFDVKLPIVDEKNQNVHMAWVSVGCGAQGTLSDLISSLGIPNASANSCAEYCTCKYKIIYKTFSCSATSKTFTTCCINGLKSKCTFSNASQLWSPSAGPQLSSAAARAAAAMLGPPSPHSLDTLQNKLMARK